MFFFYLLIYLFNIASFFVNVLSRMRGFTCLRAFSWICAHPLFMCSGFFIVDFAFIPPSVQMFIFLRVFNCLFFFFTYLACVCSLYTCQSIWFFFVFLCPISRSGCRSDSSRLCSSWPKQIIKSRVFVTYTACLLNLSK